MIARFLRDRWGAPRWGSDELDFVGDNFGVVAGAAVFLVAGVADFAGDDQLVTLLLAVGDLPPMVPQSERASAGQSELIGRFKRVANGCQRKHELQSHVPQSQRPVTFVPCGGPIILGIDDQ